MRAYFKLYRASLTWRNTQQDNALPVVVQWLRALDPIMDHFGYKYAHDLSLFRMRATFMEAFSSHRKVMKVARCAPSTFDKRRHTPPRFGLETSPFDSRLSL